MSSEGNVQGTDSAGRGDGTRGVASRRKLRCAWQFSGTCELASWNGLLRKGYAAHEPSDGLLEDRSVRLTIPEAFEIILLVLETQLSNTYKPYAGLWFHIQHAANLSSLDLPDAAFQGIFKRVPVFFP